MHLSTCFRESTSLKISFQHGERKRRLSSIRRGRRSARVEEREGESVCAHTRTVHVRIFHFQTIISGGYTRWLVWKKRLHLWVEGRARKKRREEQRRQWRQQGAAAAAAVGEYDDDDEEEEEEEEERRKRGTTRKIILCRPTPSFYLTWTHTTLPHI